MLAVLFYIPKNIFEAKELQKEQVVAKNATTAMTVK